ncbi:MAG: hypothetical protein U0989_16640 [Azonexus sp.]|nr:hypothetical protein [Azonexus sp.]MDZ4316381.1 hypothetical protein [Azonexus sp.]
MPDPASGFNPEAVHDGLSLQNAEDEDDQPGAFGFSESAESESDAAGIFSQVAEGRNQGRDEDKRQAD